MWSLNKGFHDSELNKSICFAPKPLLGGKRPRPLSGIHNNYCYSYWYNIISIVVENIILKIFWSLKVCSNLTKNTEKSYHITKKYELIYTHITVLTLCFVSCIQHHLTVSHFYVNADCMYQVIFVSFCLVCCV